MKIKDNTSTRILLGVALLGIWGTIIYRVYQNMQGTKRPITTFNLKDWTQPTTKTNTTFQLSLNYSDPFLKKTIISPSSPVTSIAPTPPPSIVSLENILPKTPPKKVNFPSIKYIGYVQSPESGQKSVFLSVQGKKYKRQLGETIDKMHLTLVTKDSIQVYLDGGNKIIYRGK